jgi:predicted AlkP superfamily pyrophosphatase or phosphodiesterase
VAFWGCAPSKTSLEHRPILVLVSIDGFRWDFRDRTATPFLDEIAERGVSARRLVPAFPTRTFPNHFTIVTGLYPEHHGLVANSMYDPVFDATYKLGKREEVGNGRWYDAEPIWVTAESQGLATAPVFWPGSEAEIGGYRPTYWEPFDGSRSDPERVDRLLALLELPPTDRPVFLTTYFEVIDDTVHRLGTHDSGPLRDAIEHVDEMIGRLVEGFESLGIASRVDLIVLSDHGMSQNSRERVILIDDYIDPAIANPVTWDPVLGLWPRAGHESDILAQLTDAHPHLSIFRREDVPPELHYSTHRRIPPIIALADDGWAITTRERFSSCSDCFTGGNHGFDPRLESMGALFVAAGPSLSTGVRLDELESIHLYELMCAILGIDPRPNDGDLDSVVRLLADTDGRGNASAGQEAGTVTPRRVSR